MREATTDEELAPYFAGERLYGNDFDEELIAAWFAHEAEAYVDLAGTGADDDYPCDALSRRFGFGLLPKGRHFTHAVGFGSGNGAELAPLVDRVDRISIIESSARYEPSPLLGGKAVMAPANPDGSLPIADGDADLLTSLGVLHHIPNVSYVLGELARVCAVGGWLVLREPIISLGDWRHRRPGLTPRERGIPVTILRSMLADAGFAVREEHLFGFPLIQRLTRVGLKPYNSTTLVRLDSAISSALATRTRYHATTRLQKLRATSVALVAERVTPADAR